MGEEHGHLCVSEGVLEKKGQTENATMKEGFAQMLTELEKHPVPEIGKTWMMPDYWALEEIAGSIEDDVMARIREKALEIDENSSMTDDQKSEEMKQYVNASPGRSFMSLRRTWRG